VAAYLVKDAANLKWILFFEYFSEWMLDAAITSLVVQQARKDPVFGQDNF
jgi:hypothetical protein